MIESKTTLPGLEGGPASGQPKPPADHGAGQGQRDHFAQTLEGKRRELQERKAAKPEETRGQDRSRADDGESKKPSENGEAPAKQKSDKAEEPQAKGSETSEERKEEEKSDATLVNKDFGKAIAEAGEGKGEQAVDEDGKELPPEQQVVAGLAVAEAAKEGGRKTREGVADGAAGREAVRPRVLEAVAEAARGNGRAGERDAGSEADRRFFQGLQERLGEQRATQDGEALMKASKQESERGLQGFLRTLQQAGAREAGTNPNTQGQAAPVNPGTSAVPAGQNAPATPPTLNLQTPVNQQGWDRALGERVAWMAKDGVQEARIQLQPRNMGPIEVRLSVNQDQASVHFTAQHGMTREAIEQAMPRLREMLAEQGLDLTDSQVADHGPEGREQSGEGLADGGGDGDGNGRAGPADGEPGAETEGTQVGEAVIGPSGLDYYA